MKPYEPQDRVERVIRKVGNWGVAIRQERDRIDGIDEVDTSVSTDLKILETKIGLLKIDQQLQRQDIKMLFRGHETNVGSLILTAVTSSAVSVAAVMIILAVMGVVR